MIENLDDLDMIDYNECSTFLGSIWLDSAFGAEHARKGILWRKLKHRNNLSPVSQSAKAEYLLLS